MDGLVKPNGRWNGQEAAHHDCGDSSVERDEARYGEGREVWDRRQREERDSSLERRGED